MVYRFEGFSFDEAGLVIAILIFSLMVGFFLKSFMHWLGKKVQKTELDLDIEALKQEHALKAPVKEEQKAQPLVAQQMIPAQSSKTIEAVKLETYGEAVQRKIVKKKRPVKNKKKR